MKTANTSQIYSVFNTQKNPLIEIINRILLNKLSKQQTINGNQKWLKILPERVKNLMTQFIVRLIYHLV